MAAHGPTKAPVDPREEFRRRVREQLVSSYRESIFIALMFVAIGGTPVVWSLTSHFDAHWRHGVAPVYTYAAAFLVLAGFIAWHGRKWYGFPWDLDRRGTVGRGVVVALEGKPVFRSGRRYRSSGVVQSVTIAVKVEGGAPYEAKALVVEDLHGELPAGTEVRVFVDPKNPRRVLVAEPSRA